MSEQKKPISQAEFEKKVEFEFEYLVYTEYMKKDEAWRKARDTVSKEYEAVKR